MLVRVIKSTRDIVVVCDSDLIGKKFDDGKFQLDIKENFYNGEEMSESEAILIMNRMQREDATFNIVGKKAINAALKTGIINKAGIKTIQGIPFALVLL
ncbi:Uncharacterised protein [uncultured archaeon]|nr:Uncharacterised protein [uncultured archaeon]